MITVGIEGFGSIWSIRNGLLPERTAFYNTTGIVIDGRLRHRSRIFGALRFNAIGGFNPRHIEGNIGRIFQSPGIFGPESQCLLLHHLLNKPQRPDYHLFTVTSEHAGEFEIDRSGWKSADVVLMSFSQFRERQEAMLLMPAHSWIRGGLGHFVTAPYPDRPWRAFLELKG